MQVSNCCGAKLKLMPTDKIIDGKTYWWQCTRCAMPCNGLSESEKELIDRLSKPPKCMHDPSQIIDEGSHWLCGKCGLELKKVLKYCQGCLSMNLESQVVSLDLAKRLKELGFIKPSLFCWFHKSNGEWVLCNNNLMPWIAGQNCNEEQSNKEVAAFTVAELGEILPRIITWSDGAYALNQDFYADGTFNIYYSFDNYAPIDFTDDKEADVRAKILIYLIERGLYKNE